MTGSRVPNTRTPGHLKVMFITPYFPPEVGAPQTRIWAFATRLASRGHEITVVTGRPHYPTGLVPAEYRNGWLQRERMGDLQVLRGWVYAAPNKGFLPRILDQASFALTAMAVACLLYTSPSPRDRQKSRMPSSA